MSTVTVFLPLLCLLLSLVKGQDPCEHKSMTPIRTGSKYLMPDNPNKKGLATYPDNRLFSINDISEFCHYPGDPLTPDELAADKDQPLKNAVNLEMVSIRHYHDWISIQKFMRNDLKQWEAQGGTEPQPQNSDSKPHDQSIFSTGMRYRYPNDPKAPGYTTELMEDQTFFVWDTDDQSDALGVAEPQPNAEEGKEQSVDIILRQVFDQQDKPEVFKFIAARDKEETYEQHYRFICQFPRDSECYRNSNEEKDNRDPVKLQELIWTSKAMFEISSRPVSLHEAQELCSKPGKASHHGFTYQMWNGELPYTLINDKLTFPKDIPPSAEITNESEALELGDAILEWFLHLDIYPFTPFFLSASEPSKRLKLSRPSGRESAVAQGHFVVIDPKPFSLHKTVDAFVLCSHPLNQVCLPKA